MDDMSGNSGDSKVNLTQQLNMVQLWGYKQKDKTTDYRFTSLQLT